MKVFWDTNIFIYLIEKHPAFHSKVVQLYEAHQSRGERVVTSALTLGELIAQPLRLGRVDLARSYVALLTSGERLEVVPFDCAAAECYGRIRSETALRQPDAIQMACAVASGAKVFIMNDQHLWPVAVPGLELIRGL